MISLLHDEHNDGEVKEKKVNPGSGMGDQNKSGGYYMPLVDHCQLHQYDHSFSYIVKVITTNNKMD